MTGHSRTRMRLLSQRGLTIVETVIAAVVLVVVIGTVTYGVGWGTRQRGKRLVLSSALRIADTEVERLKFQASFADSIADSTYETSEGNFGFRVERHVVPDTSSIVPLQPVRPKVQDISVQVFRPGEPHPLVRLRTLEGFCK